MTLTKECEANTIKKVSDLPKASNTNRIKHIMSQCGPAWEIQKLKVTQEKEIINYFKIYGHHFVLYKS